jgi:uncharacterized protein YndB with AHSA1/START domain
MNNLTIQKSIQINASANSVFGAVTEPKQILQYYPITHISADLSVGGQFILQGQVDGHPFTDYGVIEAYEPDILFRYNYWSDNHGTENITSNRMVIEYRIEEDSDKCVAHLTHRNLLTDERKTMMDGVWEFLLSQLKQYVENT